MFGSIHVALTFINGTIRHILYCLELRSGVSVIKGFLVGETHITTASGQSNVKFRLPHTPTHSHAHYI